MSTCKNNQYKLKQNTCACTRPPCAPKTLNCPCQVKPGVLSVPCQTVRSSVSEYFKYPNCYRNCNQTRKDQILPKFDTKGRRKKQFVCRICKKRKEHGDYELDEKKKKSYSIGREKSIIFDVEDETSESNNLKMSQNDDAEEDVKLNETGLVQRKSVRASAFFVTLPFMNSFGKTDFYQEKQANFAFVQKGCKCKWKQTQRCIPPGIIRQCPVAFNCAPGCMCKRLDPPYYQQHSNKSVQCNNSCSVQCSSCPWFNQARNDYQSTRYVQTPIAAPPTRYFCCPNCNKKSRLVPKPEPQPEQQPKFPQEEPRSRPMSLFQNNSSFMEPEPEPEMVSLEPSDLESSKSISIKKPRAKTRLSYPLYARSTPFFDDLYKKNVNEQPSKERSHFIDEITNLLSKYYALKWESDLAQSTNEYGNSFLSDFIEVDDENSHLKRLLEKLERERLVKALASKMNKKSLVIEPKSSSSTDSNEDIKRKHKRLLKALLNNVLDINEDEVTTNKNIKKRQKSESKKQKENNKKRENLANDNSEESLGKQIENFDNLFDRINKLTKESRFNVMKLQNAINAQERHKNESHKPEKIRRSAVRIEENDPFLDLFKACRRKKGNSGKNVEWSDSSSSSQEIIKQSRSKQASKNERKKPKPNLKVKTKANQKSKNPTRRRK